MHARSFHNNGGGSVMFLARFHQICRDNHRENHKAIRQGNNPRHSLVKCKVVVTAAATNSAAIVIGINRKDL